LPESLGVFRVARWSNLAHAVIWAGAINHQGGLQMARGVVHNSKGLPIHSTNGGVPHATVRDCGTPLGGGTYHVPYTGQTTLGMYEIGQLGESLGHVAKHDLGGLDAAPATFTAWFSKKSRLRSLVSSARDAERPSPSRDRPRHVSRRATSATWNPGRSGRSPVAVAIGVVGVAAQQAASKALSPIAYAPGRRSLTSRGVEPVRRSPRARERWESKRERTRPTFLAP
jgi:hypothetical protein